MKRLLVSIQLIFLFGCVQIHSDKIPDPSLTPIISTDSDISYEAMVEGFNHPPGEVRMKSYWIWLNGQVTKESITRELEGMKSKGYGGAVICDALAVGGNTKEVPHGPDFGSDEWLELLSHTVKEADRLKLVLSLNVQSGWNMGGPTVLPYEAMKKIVFVEQNFEGSQKIKVKLDTPDTLLFYEDIAVQAFKKIKPESSENTILEWGLKSFNESIGMKGIYPLEIYRNMRTGNIQDEVIPEDQITDLTSYFKNGVLEWDVPEDEWTIVRYGMTCTGKRPRRPSENADGLCLDHLNKDALDSYYRQVILPLIKTAQKAGNSLKYLHTDSWEMNMANWTQDFREEFESRRGYDPLKYLPVLTNKIVESREVSNRFLFDFRQTVGDLIAEDHYQHFADLSHENGLLMHPESGGPHAAPIDGLYTMSFNDELMGEFWARASTHRTSEAERLTVRQSASAAHTNGKRFATAEGPTSVGPQWERSPKELKSLIDRVFCSGINKIVWHSFSASPERFGKPGNSYFAGTHLNPNVTWWNQSDAFIDYINRCSYLLSLGHFKADVLYYYGSNVPNFVFMKNEVKELNEGYDWDKCSKDILLNRASVVNGKLVLSDGMSYRLLVLPDEKSMDLEVLKKVEELIKDGLTVISPRPQQATGLTNYPESDREVAEIAQRIWGNIDGNKVTENSYGKGLIVWGKDINSVLEEMNVMSDLTFQSTQKNTSLDYIHRTTKDQEIYFVANRFARKGVNDFEYRYLTDLPDRFEQVECKFRITGKIPELWDPMTGEIREIYIYREEKGYTKIPLYFTPGGAQFIIFRETKESELHITEMTKNSIPFFPDNHLATQNQPLIEIKNEVGSLKTHISEPGEYELIWSDEGKSVLKVEETAVEQPLSGSWEVTFDTDWGGPGTVVTDELKSWTKFDEEGIKYYSGTAVYKKEFNFSPTSLDGKRVILDLGNLHELATVYLNGKTVGTVWISPFITDVTDRLMDGTNHLEVDVVNLWPNRLILDDRLPKEKRLTQTNVYKFEEADAEKYLRESGLIGPVKIITKGYKNLKRL